MSRHLGALRMSRHLGAPVKRGAAPGPGAPGGDRVTVLGAGPEPLACALALAHHGVGVALARSGDGDPGELVTVSPNGARVLHALRLRAPLERFGFAPEHVYFRHWRSGFILGHRPLGALAAARHGAPYRIGPADELDGILRDCLDAHGVPVTAIGAAGIEGEGERTAVLLDGRPLPLAVLAGPRDGLPAPRGTNLADGACGRRPQEPLWETEIWFVAADAIREPAPAIDHWLGPGCVVTQRPVVRGGALRGVQVLATRTDPRGAQAWEHAHPHLRSLRERARDLRRLPISTGRPAPCWFQGHVVLAGRTLQDAPLELDQAGSLALEDAWVLACLLDHYDDAPEEALAQYEAARRPRRERVARGAVAWTRRLALLPGRGARRRDLRIALEARLLPELALQRIDWLYGYNLPGRFF